MRIESETLTSAILSEPSIKQNRIEMSNEINKETSKDNTISDNILAKEPIAHQVSPKTISKAVDDVNKKLNSSNAECKFSVHKATGQITVKVMDKETGDVIREIPSEKILDMVATALEMAGILMDEKR